ncbi:NAD(P)-dependent dehydrogenase (short-subunit alcohol dehydrogenase family) [Rhizomicrobium palustre]|uniref:NAD(P)-dependent dehydrogenase (Short-subunit alcohol dehydrogenase family) n=1 Tax=Rhizomicrobium palustre TaxID=189966 RepID=A0A846N418_9PROT|nr:SDR family oxidoreductase [Rhizomicrobium palustre]NIK90259.1 NAD(P)-dependent dehydrogenase (short-subunit alcohol dehydrogenase family) [Rhizomicrobium palustre]
MDLQLKNKTALVTGSTAGIGLEIARALAAEGADVVIAGRNQEKLDAATKDLSSAGKITPVLADAATAEGVARLIEAVPSVDILVNNLGIYESKDFADITDEDWFRFFETNVMSGVRLSRAYFPAMIARNWGRIIFISSESGLSTPGEMVHYGVTKTAQLALTRGLAAATKGTGVTVNSVLPGPTRSDGILDFLKSVSTNPNGTPAELETEFFQKLRPASLLQRMIEPQEVANLVAYVASPLSSATNGASLRAEGGLLTTIG